MKKGQYSLIQACRRGTWTRSPVTPKDIKTVIACNLLAAGEKTLQRAVFSAR